VVLRKAHAHGGNIPAVLAPGGFPFWVSPVEPGSMHDLTAARTHALPALNPAAALPTRCRGERGFAMLTGRWRTLQHIVASPRQDRRYRAALVLGSQNTHRNEADWPGTPRGGVPPVRCVCCR
jgi:hypothetical protein